MVQRIGMAIGIKPEAIAEYKHIHANCWPEVLAMLKAAHISNYSIFLREPENLLFSYFEYSGDDFDADMARIAEDVKTQEWWTHTDPMQAPFPTRATGEHWVTLENVFYME